MRALDEAREYYQLSEDASFREMIAHVRADEACHRDLNHHFADIPHYADVEMHTVSIVTDDVNKLEFGIPEEEQPLIEEEQQPFIESESVHDALNFKV